MAATRQCHILAGFIVLLCVITGVFSKITVEPENTLLVLCEDENVMMNCTSNTTNEITWTYDGNAVVSAPCEPNVDDGIFDGIEMDDDRSCHITASQTASYNDPRIQTISGPYGCTDRDSKGVTATSMTVVLDMWCGVIDNCVAKENKDVTVGCYASYDWLSYLLQYNPIVRINASLQWINDPTSFVNNTQLNIPFFLGKGAPSQTMTTTTTFYNVQPGDIITEECRVDFVFIEREPDLSTRNSYANNTLSHVCRINQTVHYCPKNINITTSCLVRHSLRCHADGFPEPNYLWIDNLRGGNATYGETIELTEAGPFNYTCIAYSNISCDANSQRPFCRNKSSLWYDGYQNDTYFPYSLFNATNTSYQYIYEEKCINSTSIYGIAFECPNMTMEALNGSVCWNNSEVVLMEPSTVSFYCTFENTEIGVTTYMWMLDGEVQESYYNMRSADIHIPSGSHHVTCQASVNITYYEGIEKLTPEQIAECQCNDKRTINVAVIECTDNVTITPRDDCVQQYTDFTCLATHGHEIGPYYTWNIDTPNGIISPWWSFPYRVNDLGWYNLTCEAKYTHEYCPEYYAICNDSITFQVFDCPNITLYGNSSSECLETRYIYDEIVLLQRDVVDFHCVFDFAGTTTMYTWYVDGKEQTVTRGTFRYNFTSTTAYAYVVECRGMIFVDANCSCYGARTINVTIIVCEDPTLQPQDLCVEEGTNYTCMATLGYPPPPIYDFYYWHHEDTIPIPVSLTPPSYAVYRIGNFSVSCCVNYAHPVYPECYAKCCANITSSIVECPNITLYGNSSCVQTSDEMILVGRSVVGFYCDYEMDGATTIYSWYIDDVEQSGFAGKTFQYDFATTNTAYTYVVKCGGRIEVTDNWFCSENRTMNVTIVDCQDPILEPPDLCVSPGTNYTCMATSGYPPPPTYDFYYWHHEDGGVVDYTIRSSLTPPSYAVHRIGNFSVSCCVNYAHPVYPECYATCYANTTVFICPESIWLWHNATNSSYPKLSTEYNRPLSFNKTIAIEFECIYEPKFYHITTFEWTVTAESDDGLPFQTQGNDRFLQYYFEDTGDYVVKCRAWFVIENCTCDNMTDVLITINVPKNETCTCPCLHWPPVIPPIFAILISILMIPCYCYSCGPWSGPYWAEERRKHQPRQLCSRPTATNAYNAGARFRPLTNGYGAF